MENIIIAIIISMPIIMFCAFIVLFFYVPIPLWIKARFCDLRVGVFQLLAMKARGTNTKIIIDNAIKLKMTKIPVTLEQLESHCLAKGNVPKLTEALIMAKKRGLNLDFKYLAAIDLSGRNVERAVEEYNPDNPNLT